MEVLNKLIERRKFGVQNVKTSKCQNFRTSTEGNLAISGDLIWASYGVPLGDRWVIG